MSYRINIDSSSVIHAVSQIYTMCRLQVTIRIQIRAYYLREKSFLNANAARVSRNPMTYMYVYKAISSWWGSCERNFVL